VVIPAGTVIGVALASPIASDTSRNEDVVRAALRDDVTLEDGTMLEAGSEVVGHVVAAERSGRVKGRARIAILFSTLNYDGETYDLRTDVVERIADATKSQDATKIGIGAGAGAALGAILGGGSGAAKGAAIGAAAGTGTVLATRGEEVRLEAGAPMEMRLAGPLSLRVKVPDQR
jgi:hypothetical protein